MLLLLSTGPDAHQGVLGPTAARSDLRAVHSFAVWLLRHPREAAKSQTLCSDVLVRAGRQGPGYTGCRSSMGVWCSAWVGLWGPAAAGGPGGRPRARVRVAAPRAEPFRPMQRCACARRH